MSKHVYDYLEGGFRIFSLYNINADGSCECGDADCKAIGKHPRISNWTHVPQWSDEQIDAMMSFGHLNGFGVVVDDHLVVDIDPRNGGFESYEKLCADTELDIKALSGFVVSTGGGGWHIYFSRAHGDSLQYHLDGYPGIDFKSSGYVVGAGSVHRSGTEYDVLRGNPCDLTPVPDALLALLKRPDHYRVSADGEAMDMTTAEIASILSAINPDCPYDDWIKAGMAVHHATGGDGFALWNFWSGGGKSYPGAEALDKHWHSFGKAHNPVTIGTLMHMAERSGWRRPVTFKAPEHMLDDDAQNDTGHPFPVDTVDLLRPPGFVGKVTDFINSQCRFPREHLAVGAALNTVGNICSLRYTDDFDGVTTNLFVFGISASATGKEAVQTAMVDLHRAAGITAAVHGSIKSEQEITRNLIRHQCAYYIIDEVGIVLSKINNAARSGASYLEGVIGLLMSAYGKSNGYLLVSGDLKEDIRKEMQKERAMCESMVEENEDRDGRFAKRAEQIKEALDNLDDGLRSPVLSMIGFTTPVTFDGLMTYEQATNGFVGRSCMVREHETNPRAKARFKKPKIDPYFAASLKQLYHPGYSSSDKPLRLEHYGERIEIPSTDGAIAMLEQVKDWIHAYSEHHKGASGLEAIVRRGYELCAKVSLILACPSGLRTEEHVRYAYAFMRRDIDSKIMMAQANILAESERAENVVDVLRTRIISAAGYDEGEPISVIKRRATNKRYTADDVENMVRHMVGNGELVEVEVAHQTTGRKTLRYVAV